MVVIVLTMMWLAFAAICASALRSIGHVIDEAVDDLKSALGADSY